MTAAIQRVLHVIDSVSVSQGGPAECVVQLAAGQRALGDRVEVLAARDAPNGTGNRPDLALHALGPASGRYGFNAEAARWLRDHVTRFDVVVIHGIWQHSAYAAARAAVRSSVPYVFYPHGALDHDLPRRYPIRHVKKRVYWSLFGRALLERAAAVCFTSDMEARRATAYAGRFHGVAVGSGIAPPPQDRGEAIDLRRRFPALVDGRVFVFIGRLDPIKGVDDLIAAFAQLQAGHPRARLLIVGRGATAYLHSLQSLASRLGCAHRVAWAGQLSGPDKWAAIRVAEALVLPSHRDSFGLVVAEALAAARPVVVSDHVGTSQVVAQCGAGLVCGDDPVSLLAAMEELLARPDRAALAQAARRCYEQNFRADDAAKRLRAVITRVIGARVPSTD